MADSTAQFAEPTGGPHRSRRTADPVRSGSNFQPTSGRWPRSSVRSRSCPTARQRFAQSSTHSKRATRCCAARSAITSPAGAARSCGSSPASRICRTIPPDTPLPEAVANGVEPLLVVGAMAGG